MKKKLLLVGLLTIALLLSFVYPAFAATSQNVTITAQPSYLTISNSPGTWTLNDLTGNGYAAVDTVYYSNPLGDTTPPSSTVADGECRFTVDTTGSSQAVDLLVNCGNFTGITGGMTNSGDGSNGATTFGGYSWYSGMTYSSKVVMKESGSDQLYDELAIDTTLKWGAEIETRTDDWADDSSGTATMTIVGSID